MKALICIPTLNEAENIRNLLSAILEIPLCIEIVVVDDNSADQTAELVQEFVNERECNDKITIIKRNEKAGRGGAVWFGIKSCLRSEHTVIVEMDADFSHSPNDLREGLELIASGYDVAIGARYPNGTIVNWPVSRRVFSFCANFLARILISWKIHDYTNGYRFYSHKAATLLCSKEMKEEGYINLSETISICLRHKLTISSFPILFINRDKGKSNTSVREIVKSLTAICRISLSHHLAKKS